MLPAPDTAKEDLEALGLALELWLRCVVRSIPHPVHFPMVCFFCLFCKHSTCCKIDQTKKDDCFVFQDQLEETVCSSTATARSGFQ